MRCTVGLSWLPFVALLVACGGEDEVVFIDAGSGDAAQIVDAAAIDAPAIDAPVIDAPVIDAPVIDAAAIDASVIDASAIDASVIDASAIDAPVIDASAIDAPAIDAPAIDAPAIDASASDAPSGQFATLTVVQNGLGAAVLGVVSPTDGIDRRCSLPSCSYQVSIGATVTVFLPGTLGGSQFTGWSAPCAGTGACVVTVNAPTTVTANLIPPPGHVWVRSAVEPRIPLDLAVTSSGVVVVGRTWGAGEPELWIAHYGADGSFGTSWTENVSTGTDEAFAVSVDAGDGMYVLVRPSNQEVTLRRYTAAGALSWAIPALGATDVAADAAGNVYVAQGELVSYSPAAVERWRFTPTAGGSVVSVSVRGNLVAAGGTAPLDRGWIGMFGLTGGAPAWQYQLQLPDGCSVGPVAINSTGGIVYGRYDHAPGASPLYFQVGTASATSPPPTTTGGIDARSAQLAVDANDAAWAWIQDGSGAGTSFVRPPGGSLSSEWADPGGIAFDATGHLYLAGNDEFDYMTPVVLRR